MAGSSVWPDDARLAMSFVVNVEEGSEYNPTDGDRHPEPVDELLPHVESVLALPSDTYWSLSARLVELGPPAYPVAD